MQKEQRILEIEEDNNYKKGMYFFHSFHLIAVRILSETESSSFIFERFSRALFKTSF